MQVTRIFCMSKISKYQNNKILINLNCTLSNHLLLADRSDCEQHRKHKGL